MGPATLHWPCIRPLLARFCLATTCIAAFLLVGCASTQSPTASSAPDVGIYRQHLASIAAIKQFELQGRIGVQNEGRGFSGSTRWRHGSTDDNIGLFSPLGGQVATIITTADGVQLTDSDGKTYKAKDAETLTRQILGWSLPMQGLPDWVLGRPVILIQDGAETDIANAVWDKNGRLTRLKQDGWEIEYAEYKQSAGYQLPTKITLRGPKLYLKLIISQWTIAQGATDPQPAQAEENTQ